VARIDRINEDIHRILASLFADIKDPRINKGMLSITRVETTGDLRYAKVFISAYGGAGEKELMKGLKSAAGYLRRELGERLTLRYTPELIFELDGSIAHGARINQILGELDKISGEDDAEH